MTEIDDKYEGQGLPKNIDAYKNRACGKGIEHPDFVLPTPAEIKRLRNLLGFSQVDLAKFVGVSWNVKKGSSSVRKWETLEGKEMRKISLSAWKLMLIKAGLVVIEPIDKGKNHYEA